MPANVEREAPNETAFYYGAPDSDLDWRLVPGLQSASGPPNPGSAHALLALSADLLGRCQADRSSDCALALRAHPQHTFRWRDRPHCRALRPRLGFLLGAPARVAYQYPRPGGLWRRIQLRRFRAKAGGQGQADSDSKPPRKYPP